MIALPKTTTKRLLAVHGWSGVVLGLFLYVVVLTGAIAVFAHEIGTWSVGGKKWQDPMENWVALALDATAGTVPEEYHEEVSISGNAEGRLVLFYHTHAINPEGNFDDKGVMLELDPVSHEVLARREGFSADIFGHDPAGALDEFLVELHVSLHAPHPWGLYMTGILGFAMLAAAISGLLLHRHVLTELFLSPRLSSRLLTARDRHNLAASWGLPFAVILAFTGAFLSFAIPVGLPVLAAVAFGGDERAMIETLVGEQEATRPPQPARLAHLDGILAQSRERAGLPVQSVTIHHYGLSDAEVLVEHPPGQGSHRPPRFLYEGTTGRFIGEKPFLGVVPSTGDGVFTLTFALHFGTFAGLLSRVIWLGLGLAMAYVTLTGMRLWIERRADDPLWSRLSRAIPVFGYGLPIALAGAGIFYLLSLPAETTRFWTPFGFVVTSAAIIAAGLAIANERRLSLWLEAILGAVLLILPLLRMAVTGLGWTAEDGDVVFLIDASLVVAGAAFLRHALPGPRVGEQMTLKLPQTPAE